MAFSLDLGKTLPVHRMLLRRCGDCLLLRLGRLLKIISKSLEGLIPMKGMVRGTRVVRWLRPHHIVQIQWKCDLTVSSISILQLIMVGSLLLRFTSQSDLVILCRWTPLHLMIMGPGVPTVLEAIWVILKTGRLPAQLKTLVALKSQVAQLKTGLNVPAMVNPTVLKTGPGVPAMLDPPVLLRRHRDLQRMQGRRSQECQRLSPLKAPGNTVPGTPIASYSWKHVLQGLLPSLSVSPIRKPSKLYRRNGIGCVRLSVGMSPRCTSGLTLPNGVE